jgi:glycosyltransferase involved in cell wall biosynthesis
MTPMRVLLAPSAYHPQVGGIEELTRQLALALQTRGHETAVLTNRWPDGLIESEVVGGLEVKRLRFPLPAMRLSALMRFIIEAPPAAWAVAHHVRNWRAEVVHVIGAGPQSAYLGMLANRLGAPLVLTTQGELSFDAHDVFERSVTLRVGLRRTVRQARVVTACSAYALRDLDASVSPTCPSMVIPNGVDPAEFAGADAAESDLGRYVLGVGRLVPQKGFDLLIDAFATTELAGMNLVIAGDGYEREALAGRAVARGIADRVHLLGTVDRTRLPALMRGAHAFALPSRSEPFGIALLEAMAAGVPAVSTAAGGIPEFATDELNALLVATNDVSALASALRRVAIDDGLRSRLAAEGMRTAGELAWSKIAQRYEAVYEDVRARMA